MPGKLPSGGGDALEELLVRASCRTSKHVKVLEEAGVVVRTIDGRTHRLDLDLDALGEAVDWFDRQRAIWDRMFDVVDDLLKEQKEAG
jgi:hypothetical protein